MACAPNDIRAAFWQNKAMGINGNDFNGSRHQPLARSRAEPFWQNIPTGITAMISA
jgi:hypothetical protein